MDATAALLYEIAGAFVAMMSSAEEVLTEPMTMAPKSQSMRRQHHEPGASRHGSRLPASCSRSRELRNPAIPAKAEITPSMETWKPGIPPRYAASPFHTVTNFRV
jgi:hypothetical protein